jgi:hypothetical protein
MFPSDLPALAPQSRHYPRYFGLGRLGWFGGLHLLRRLLY